MIVLIVRASLLFRRIKFSQKRASVSFNKRQQFYECQQQRRNYKRHSRFYTVKATRKHTEKDQI